MAKMHCAKHTRYFHVCANCRARNITFTEPVTVKEKTLTTRDFVPCRADIKCAVCR